MSDIRWKQRFENLEKAFLRLEEAKERKMDDWLQAAGLIQTFEFTLELAWKTLKDFLTFKGETVKFPREVIKTAFQAGLIEDGHLWIAMLDKRNELSHTYNDDQANQAIDLIRNQYYPGIAQVVNKLKSQMD